MAFEVYAYLVIKKTGQYDANGEEYVILYDIKLMRGPADAIAALNPGTEVEKRRIDKTFPAALQEPANQQQKP